MTAIDQDLARPRPRLSPPRLRTADGHDRDKRRASWVELFFDLIIAGAVNQLAGVLQEDSGLTTLARFAFFFVPVWWLWIQFSFYADRHESDDAWHRSMFGLVIMGSAGLAASASRAVTGDADGFVISFAAIRCLQLVLYARARRHLPATRGLYRHYLVCFGTGGALWLCSLAVDGAARYAVWAAALTADAIGGLGLLTRRWQIPLNAWHLIERFQLFVLIVLGESMVRLIGAGALRPWSLPLAAVLAAAVATLASLWWAWIRTADRDALGTPRWTARFTVANLPIVAGIAAASAGLHIAILAADGATAIGAGPRAALYGGVSVCLLATAVLPSGGMTRQARAARFATSAAAMGLVFMGAIVLPVYLVPALTVVLAIGLIAERRPPPWPGLRRPRWPAHPFRLRLRPQSPLATGLRKWSAQRESHVRGRARYQSRTASQP
jgi:low temperature requirement protein LtrA